MTTPIITFAPVVSSAQWNVGSETLSATINGVELACIPNDPGNSDYRAVLAWVEAGNTIAAAPVPAPIIPETISSRQFFQQLATQGLIQWTDCFAYLGTGVIPAIFSSAIAKLPAAEQNPATAAFMGANSFDRNNPLTIALGALIGQTPAQLDAIWTAASLLT